MPCSKCRWRSGGCGACRNIAKKRVKWSASVVDSRKLSKPAPPTRFDTGWLTVAQQRALTRLVTLDTPANIDDDLRRYALLDARGRVRVLDDTMRGMITRRRVHYAVTGWWSNDDETVETSGGTCRLSFMSTPVGDTLRIVGGFHTEYDTWPIVRDACA